MRANFGRGLVFGWVSKTQKGRAERQGARGHREQPNMVGFFWAATGVFGPLFSKKVATIHLRRFLWSLTAGKCF